MYRSSAVMTPVFHHGNTHDSREQSRASFKLSGADSGRVHFLALDKRLIGRTTVAVGATDVTIPLPTVEGLRVGESLELRGRSTRTSELMRIAEIDDANSTVTVKVSRSWAGANYWWDDGGLELTPGEAVDVRLESNPNLPPPLPRAPAPPFGVFRLFPDHHDGVNEFTFQLRFDEEFPLSYKTLKHHSLEASGGTIVHTRRAIKNSNRTWWITVQPTSTHDVSISLNKGEDCEADDAICTADGRQLHNEPTLVVPGP